MILCACILKEDETIIHLCRKVWNQIGLDAKTPNSTWSSQGRAVFTWPGQPSDHTSRHQIEQYFTWWAIKCQGCRFWPLQTDGWRRQGSCDHPSERNNGMNKILWNIVVFCVMDCYPCYEIHSIYHNFIYISTLHIKSLVQGMYITDLKLIHIFSMRYRSFCS